MAEEIKIKLKYPAPTQKGLLHEIEIIKEEDIANKAQYHECEVFIDPAGWWTWDKVPGKHLLGIEWEQDGKRYYFWPDVSDLHKLLLGFCYVTMKNDQFPLPNKRRIVERDLSGIEALLVNLYIEVRKIYGQKWIEEFLKNIDEQDSS